MSAVLEACVYCDERSDRAGVGSRRLQYDSHLSMSVAWSLHTTPGCAIIMMFGENGNAKEHYEQDKYRNFG